MEMSKGLVAWVHLARPPCPPPEPMPAEITLRQAPAPMAVSCQCPGRSPAAFPKTSLHLKLEMRCARALRIRLRMPLCCPLRKLLAPSCCTMPTLETRPSLCWVIVLRASPVSSGFFFFFFGSSL